MSGSVVPAFYLYGEPSRTADPHFVHVERLDDRSRPVGWRIRPHVHPELHQVLHIMQGGGILAIEGEPLPFGAPCLLIVPARTVHGFSFEPESAGIVLTLSTRHSDGLVLRDREIGAVLARGAALALTEDADDAASITGRLLREHGWSAPGQRAATDACVLALLVLALRCSSRADSRELRPPRSGAALVARLREHVERHFRRREKIATIAAALGTSRMALTSACARVDGTSPSSLIDARTMLEAKRMLIYADMSVAEIGYSLGFADPAYFSRFFSRHAGCPPQAFRTERHEG